MRILFIAVLTLILTGCASSGVGTNERMNQLRGNRDPLRESRTISQIAPAR